MRPGGLHTFQVEPIAFAKPLFWCNELDSYHIYSSAQGSPYRPACRCWPGNLLHLDLRQPCQAWPWAAWGYWSNRASYLLWSHLRDYSFNGLSQFSLFILSYLIIADFEPWGDSPQELTYLTPFTFSWTRVCLMANLVLLNLTLFLTVHFHAVHGYAATHMHITHVHASLPFCHHHVVISCP